MNVTVNPPNCIVHLVMIRETCPRCDGAGTQTGPTYWGECICPLCHGDKFIPKWITVEELKKLMAE